MRKSYIIVILALVCLSTISSEQLYCHFFTKTECIKSKSKCFWAKKECKEKAPRDSAGKVLEFSKIIHLCRESPPIDQVCPSYCIFKLSAKGTVWHKCEADSSALSLLE